MKFLINAAMGITTIIGLYAIEGGIVTIAWNASVPVLFGLPQATWPAGVGLVFLANAASRRRTIDKPSQ